MDALDLIILAEFLLFLALGLLALGRMLYRLVLYLLSEPRSRVPLLLKRDLALFGPLFVVVALIMFFRATGISLARNPYWIVSSGTSVVAGLAYWVYVEYFRIDQPPD